MDTSALRHRHPRLQRSSSTASKGSYSSAASDFECDDWIAHAEPPRTIPYSGVKSYGHGCRSFSLLLALPPEIVIHHLLPHLNYSALLALRLTHPYFYHSPLLYPARALAISMRVEWLAEKGPSGIFEQKGVGGVNMGSDAKFLANKHVQKLLRQELNHTACERGEKGCRVVLGWTCNGPRSGNTLQWAITRERYAAFVAVMVLIVAVMIVYLPRIDLKMNVIPTILVRKICGAADKL